MGGGNLGATRSTHRSQELVAVHAVRDNVGVSRPEAGLVGLLVRGGGSVVAAGGGGGRTANGAFLVEECGNG